MLSKARAEYQGAHICDGNKAKELGHFEYYHVEVSSTKIIQPEFFTTVSARASCLGSTTIWYFLQRLTKC